MLTHSEEGLPVTCTRKACQHFPSCTSVDGTAWIWLADIAEASPLMTVWITIDNLSEYKKTRVKKFFF